MKIYKALFVFFIVNSSINFAFSVEMKPKITLDLAVKMADACEKKRLSTNWRPLNLHRHQLLQYLMVSNLY